MKKFIVLSIVLLMLAGFAITSSAQAPAILIVKIADTEAAAPGDTVTYSYTVTNTGDCILYDVSLVDDVFGPIALLGLTDEDLDIELDDLAVDAIATGTTGYIIPVDALEYLCNIATAEGRYEEDWVSDISDEICVHTMGARTIGYWKNHEDWCGLPTESMFFGVDKGTLLAYFPGNGIEEDGVNPLEMLRVQLLAAELNVACFDGDFDYNRYEYEGDLCGYDTIYEVIDAAESFLSTVVWPTDKAEWRELRKNNADDLALKDCLEAFNDMGDEIFE